MASRPISFDTIKAKSESEALKVPDSDSEEGFELK